MAARRRLGVDGSAAVERLDRNSLFVAALSVISAVLLVRVPTLLREDAWLALVAGREVADHGIPQHDRLAVITHGARWVDQQWLSQLTMFELHQIGGLALVSIVYVGSAMSAVGLAIAAARRLGASDLQVVWILIIPTMLFLVSSSDVRTQGFAYPLFVGVLWLMTAQSRVPTRRGYLLFPVLVMWANLHGSVVIGVAIGVIHGLSLLVAARRAAPGSPSTWRRALVFIAASPLCLLVTPYGLAIVGYYRDTLLNSAFRSVITEWQPVTSAPLLAIPFFLVAFSGVWLLGRSREPRPLFEHLVLYMVIANGISAARNVSWLALSAIVLLPGVLRDATGPESGAPRRRNLNLTLAGLGVVMLLGSIAAVAAQPRTWFEANFDARAPAFVADAARADPSLRVYSVGRLADWLLWKEPKLAGRVAYDSRLELLTDAQTRRLTEFVTQKGPRNASVIDGYGLLVLDPVREPTLTRDLSARADSRVIFRRRNVVIIQRMQR